MVTIVPQWSSSVAICARHGLPVTFRTEVWFRSRPPVLLCVAVLVVVIAAGLPVVVPAARYLDDPDPELYLLLLFGGLFAGWLVHNVMLRQVSAPAWGFCDVCRALRSRLVGTAVTCFLLTVCSCALYVPFVLPEQVGGDELSPFQAIVRWAVAVAPGVFAIVGAVLLAFARWSVLAGGVAGKDGTVVLRRPVLEFVRAIAELGRAAEKA